MDISVDASEVQAFASKFKGAQAIVQTEMKSAMTESTLTVQSGAQSRVSVVTGNLRRSLTTQVTGGAGTVTGKVGTNAPYGRIVEEGRGPIDAGPGRVLRFIIGGEVIFRRRVGPAAPKPYLRPALDAARGKIRSRFQDVPRRVLAKLTG